MASRPRVPVKLLEARFRVGGGYHTVWRDTSGQRVYIQIAPGADLQEAYRRIRRRLTLTTT